MLVIIPARGGSKGIPGKNIKKLNDKPLIQYTIDAARDIFNDNDILVSTDDERIKKTVEDLGLTVPFLRPPELATDKAGTREVLIHALDYMKSKGRIYETILLLQPTSPFRNSTQIKEAIQIFKDYKLEMVVSVKETKANPYYVLREDDENGFLKKSKEGNFKRRQDAPKVWELNGAIYVIDAHSIKNVALSDLKKVRKYVMDDFSSHDIDEPLDWIVAEALIKQF